MKIIEEQNNELFEEEVMLANFSGNTIIAIMYELYFRQDNLRINLMNMIENRFENSFDYDKMRTSMEVKKLKVVYLLSSTLFLYNNFGYEFVNLSEEIKKIC